MGSSGLFWAGCMQWLPLGIPLVSPFWVEVGVCLLAMLYISVVIIVIAGRYLRSGELNLLKRVIAGISLVLGGGLLICSLLITTMVVSVPFSRTRQPRYRPSCANNLKQWGLVCKMFSGESKGMYYPELSPEAGRLMVACGENRGMPPIFREYLQNLIISVCPKDPALKKVVEIDWDALEPGEVAELLNDRWYLYLGYVLRSDEEVLAFAKAYLERVAEGKRFDEDLKVAPGEGNYGTDTLYQLREGIEGVLTKGVISGESVAAALAETPVMIERVENNHEPKGGHVLYMDGHVEFVPYPGKWPMTETTMMTLEELANMDGKPPVVQKPEEVSSRLRVWAVALAVCIIVGIAIGLFGKWGLLHAKAQSREGGK